MQQPAEGEDDRGARAREKLAKYISTIFPSIFEAKNSYDGLGNELIRHHEYYNFFFRLNHNKTPVLAAVQMMTMQSFLLFLLALLYDLNYPDDDGSCVSFTSPDKCLARRYMLDDSQSYCKWQEDTQTCAFAQPSFSILTAMYISMVISLATCLAMEPLEAIMKILSSPTTCGDTDSSSAGAPVAVAAVPVAAEPVEAAPVALAAQRWKKLKAAVPKHKEALSSEPAMEAMDMALTSLDRHGSMRHIPDHAIVAQLEALQYAKQIALQTQPLLEKREAKRLRLVKRLAGLQTGAFAVNLPKEVQLERLQLTTESLHYEINLQRTMLSEEQRKRFDRLWGLHAFRGSFLQRDYHHWRKGRQIYDVQQVVTQELADVQKEAARMTEELAKVSDVDRGFEILQVFIMDLLGRHSPAARIFASKAELDFEKVSTSTKRAKVVAGIFIACLNIFFVFYTMLKGYSKGVYWQQDYFRQWILQIVLDIFIFETLQCIWVHFAVPYLVSKEVNAVYASMQQTIDHLCDSVYFDNYTCLNAPRYLFVSYQLADAFPQLVESTLVKAFSNHLPGQAGMLWLSKLNQIDMQEERRAHGRSAISWWLPRSFLVTLLVQIAAYAPMQLQKMLIRVLEPMILSVLTVSFYLLVARPAFISVLFVALALIIGLMVWDYYRVKEVIKTSNIDQPVGSMPEEEEDVNNHRVAPAPAPVDADLPVPTDWMSDEEFSMDDSSEEDKDDEEDSKGSDHTWLEDIWATAAALSMHDSEEGNKDKESDDKPSSDNSSWDSALKALAFSESSSNGSRESDSWDIEKAMPVHANNSDNSFSMSSSEDSVQVRRPEAIVKRK